LIRGRDQNVKAEAMQSVSRPRSNFWPRGRFNISAVNRNRYRHAVRAALQPRGTPAHRCRDVKRPAVIVHRWQDNSDSTRSTRLHTLSISKHKKWSK